MPEGSAAGGVLMLSRATSVVSHAGAAPSAVQLAAARRLYVQAAAAYDVAVSMLQRDARPDLDALERIAQRTVDLVRDDFASVVGLTTVKALTMPPADRILRTHAVNVMLHSVALALAVGIERTACVSIALAGLLHDLGRDVNLESDGHGLTGVSAILRAGAMDRVAHAAWIAVEHQEEFRGPVRTIASGSEDPSLGIVRIADAYDDLTARPGLAGSPDLVVAFLLQATGARFEPTLLQRFAQLLGIYPPGTTVRLTGGEIGVVVRPNPAIAKLDRPLVRVWRDSGGLPVAGEEWLDLDSSPGTRIVASMDPAAFGIVPADLFLR